MSFTPGPGTTYLLTSSQPLPSGTANGVLFLNASKVVSSGSALTFDGTTLGIGKLAIRNDAPFLTGANISSGSNPLAIGGGAGNSVVAFFINNSEAMRLNTTGMGIGTNNPGARLHVRDTSAAAATALAIFIGQNSYDLNIQSVTSGSGIIGNRFNFSIGSSTGEFSWSNNGGERMRLDSSGNLGINTTSVGTSAVGVLSVGSGTEPSSGPADTVQFYSVDRSAGNTIPAVYCEGSGVTNAGITNVTVTNKIALKVNGTVYYLLATTNAT